MDFGGDFVLDEFLHFGVFVSEVSHEPVKADGFVFVVFIHGPVFLDVFEGGVDPWMGSPVVVYVVIH